MKNREGCVSDLRSTWLPGVALVVMLYLMYSPVFLTDYLMQDEWNCIGSHHNLVTSSRNAFFALGRGLNGTYSTLIYRFVDYDLLRIQLVRFANFASISTIALLLFLFFSKRSSSPHFAFLITLFFFSQRPWQAAVAYSLQLISNTQPAMWLSLIAFSIHFFDQRRFPNRLRPLLVFLILMVAMQSTQTYAFFSMVPLTYLALTDWTNQRRRILSFLLIAFAVFLASSLVYKVGLVYWNNIGEQGYRLGEQGLNALTEQPIRVLLHAINPATYWGAFEMWSFPFPIHTMLPLKGMDKTIALLIMVVFVTLNIGAVIAESQKRSGDERWQVLLKWSAVLVALGFGAVYFIADSPLRVVEHRPHMTLTFVGVVISCTAYSLEVLATRLVFVPGALIKCLGVVLVLASAFGAQSGVLRGLVHNRAAQLDFIRSELMAGCPSGCQNIVVVLPKWHGCVTEPCGPWVGHVTEGERHIRHEGAYRYALATLNISPEVASISFVEARPEEVPGDSVIIDWSRYVAAKRAHQHYLRHTSPLARLGS